jgi:uncharacterized protein (DUF2141 family)
MAYNIKPIHRIIYLIFKEPDKVNANKPAKFATAFMKRPLSIKLLLGCLFAILLIAEGTGLSGCANMIPPTGGPRDSLPPELLAANPPDSSRNFDEGRITLVFDEFVELNNIQQNLIVSPTLKYVPTVESRLRTVTIRIKDTLEPNTTYSFNFGNAIRDINEGNEVKDFTYIFTTGREFDTLRLFGRVIIAETGGIDSTLIVMLHRNLADSAVEKEKPRYYTRVRPDGSFRFQNLPAGTFAIYALKDEGGMLTYRDSTQLFGFADQPVQTGAGAQPITLYAYREAPDTRGNRGTNTGGGGPGARQPGRGANTQQDRILRISMNTENGQLDLLSNLEVRFQTPLRTFDPAKVRFTDEQFNTIPNPNLTLDSTRKIITLKYPWAGGNAYNLIVEKDFAEDTLGRKLLRSDTLSFRTKREADYGALKLRFLNLDLSKNPVLLFVQNEQVKYSHVFTSREVNIRLFLPGEYDLRILYDENRNGKWDPGEFFGQKRQPEKVQPLTRRLNVKPNWDNEIDITL